MNKKIMTEVIIPYTNEDASKDQESKNTANGREKDRVREKEGET
jgi:hypothetical protein